jgi:DNA-binding response OmpR family regulator
MYCVHGGAPLISGLCVLIVDRSDESRLVLRTTLERRGVRVLETRRVSDGLAFADAYRPDLVVLDLETADISERAPAEFAAVTENNGATLLMLGNDLRVHGIEGAEIIAKPYHYRPLIHKIEELLRRRHYRAAA